MLGRHDADNDLRPLKSRGQIVGRSHGIWYAAAGKEFLVDPLLRHRFADIGFVRPQAHAMRAFAPSTMAMPVPQAPPPITAISLMLAFLMPTSSLSGFLCPPAGGGCWHGAGQQ